MPKSNVKTEKMEMLIELVRENPVLYDARMAEHKDSQLIYNTWQKIARQLDMEKFGGEC